MKDQNLSESLQETLYQCKGLTSLLEELYPSNPYWEKWSKGRPSKQKVEKRKLSYEWEKDQRTRYPERTPMLSYLLSDENKTGITKRDGKIMIQYIPRLKNSLTSTILTN